MNPKVAQRAARMTVLPCDTPGIYHVGGGTNQHTVTQSKRSSDLFYCDSKCQAYMGGNRCAHQLATKWYIQRTQQAQSA